jgi:hypothetical protein
VTLGQPSFEPDFGTAMRFDGSSAFIDVPNSVGGDFTLEAWINTTAPSLTGSQAYQGNAIDGPTWPQRTTTSSWRYSTTASPSSPAIRIPQ